MAEKPIPSADQLAALQRYANKHGRNWKSRLKEAWQSGQDAVEPHDGGLLRQVRNQFGPIWLSSPANAIRPQS